MARRRRQRCPQCPARRRVRRARRGGRLAGGWRGTVLGGFAPGTVGSWSGSSMSPGTAGFMPSCWTPSWPEGAAGAASGPRSSGSPPKEPCRRMSLAARRLRGAPAGVLSRRLRFRATAAGLIALQAVPAAVRRARAVLGRLFLAAQDRLALDDPRRRVRPCCSSASFIARASALRMRADLPALRASSGPFLASTIAMTTMRMMASSLSPNMVSAPFVSPGQTFTPKSAAIPARPEA